jgi:CBS domain-containing protein
MTNRKLAYIVKDQAPLILLETDTVARACAAMTEQGVGTVLVTDAAERLVGIFTGRDAVRQLARDGAPATTPLSRAMTRNPVSVAPDQRAVDALRAMMAGGFRHVPVVVGERILGIVSRGDFQGMELEHHRWCDHGCVSGPERRVGDIVARQKPLVHDAEDTVRQACQSMARRKSGSVLVLDKRSRLSGIFTGRDAVRILGKAKDPGGTPLGKAMTRKPVTIDSDRHAIDALRTMSEGGFRHLPVMHNDNVLGVVSRSDFTGCEMDRLEEEQHLAECIW